MNFLILEDCGDRIFSFKQRLIGHDYEFTKDPKYCIELLKTKNWDYLFLDHDMTYNFEQPGEGTGYEVAEWISNNPERKPRRILLHTMNNIGAAAMMLVLGKAKIRASYVPLLWEKLDLKERSQNNFTE